LPYSAKTEAISFSTGRLAMHPDNGGIASAGIKARAALEAIKGAMTVAEISTKYSVHPNMVIRWRRELLENAAGIFDHKKNQKTVEAQEKIDDLHKNTGELTMERDWLKKLPRRTAV